MISQKFSFENSNGIELSAYLDLPLDKQAKTFALFAHCFTCSKNLIAIKHISRALTREGIAVLRFDFTGLGDSQGDFSDTNFSTNVSDLIDAANYLTANHETPQLIVGHSLGGPAAIAAASQIPDCRAVVTIGSPCEPEHVSHLFEELTTIIRENGQAEARIGGRKFTIKAQFLENLEETSMQSVISNLGKALLVCHSPHDQTVGIDQAAKIYEAAKHPKSFISLDQADHLLMKAEDSLYVGTVIASWARKYIDLPLDHGPTIQGKEQYVVTRTDSGELLTEINANGHFMIADEPKNVGGTNLGPTPYELLAAALGTCTGMTLQMYAKFKKLPLRSVTVNLKHDKVHAEDGASCEEKDNKIDVIEREILIDGDLNDEQYARMQDIADRCPVHKTLSECVEIKTQFK